jgi:hypothetical protein
MLSGRSARTLTRGETGSTMRDGSSVLLAAVLKSSETSASGRCLLNARQFIYVSAFLEDEGEACASTETLESCEEELAVLPPPLAGTVMDLDLSRVSLDWRNLGNLEVLGVVAEDE